MQRQVFLLLAGVALPAGLLASSAAGCGTTIVAGSGVGGSGGAGGSTAVGGFGGQPFEYDAGLDALPDYVDPGCPDAGPKIKMIACDPYHQNNGDCPVNQGCYIFVTYPVVPCGQEVYGSRCAFQGPGVQGSTCDTGSQCMGGFTCVVSGQGDQCVKLCPLTGQDNCPSGLVCEPIDVEGFGGCL